MRVEVYSEISVLRECCFPDHQARYLSISASVSSNIDLPVTTAALLIKIVGVPSYRHKSQDPETGQYQL